MNHLPWYSRIAYALFRLLGRLPRDRNLVFLESNLGAGLSDSPRQLLLVLREHAGLRFDAAVRHGAPRDVPGVQYVTRGSPAYFFWLARAGIWINNQNFPTYVSRPPGTTYVQTWHGTPLKRMLFDVAHIRGRTPGYEARVAAMVKEWSLLLSPSAFATSCFRSAFHYSGDVIELGYPRNDVFFGERAGAIRSRVRRHFAVPETKRLVVFAPTFRDATHASEQRHELGIDIGKLAHELGPDFQFLVRLHPIVAHGFRLPEAARGAVVDASGYPDMQELLVAADILVTDYSSTMFDFAITGRPMVFYVPDLEAYRDAQRGFYLDFESIAPGPLARTEAELTRALASLARDDGPCSDAHRAFRSRFCSLDDGDASRRVVAELVSRGVVPVPVPKHTHEVAR